MGGWGEGEPVPTEPPISLQKPPEFYDLGVKFEASKSWNSKATEKGLIIKTAADFMHQEWNAVSIIHLWVHVIYLQLELLSIQQLKPKNCWDTADEKTFAGLWDLAFLVLNDDHTVWIPCPITNLGWRTGSCRASIYICGSIHSPPRVPKAPLLLRLS